MNNKLYIPKPINTTNIELPRELVQLSEYLAKNVHEVWAAGRIADGWTWGIERNDTQKTHPSIKPYEELSEEEKEYDRRTSQETLKFIIANGFKIQ